MMFEVDTMMIAFCLINSFGLFLLFSRFSPPPHSRPQPRQLNGKPLKGEK